jgi:pyruvate kinase
MSITSRAPDVPIQKFKRSKIIATVGPSTDSFDSIVDLIEAGANGLRLNFSHGTNEERKLQIEWIRKASQQLGKPVAIIGDLQGPKLRLGDFEGIVNVQSRQSLSFGFKADFERTGIIPTQHDLSKHVKRGERLYLYDGKVRTIVTSVSEGVVHTEAQNSGILIKRKGINLPDTDFEGDIITTKDKQDIVFSSEHKVDYVAMSFVQTQEDIEHLRTILKSHNSHARIIAKIETRAALENIEAIVMASDAVMIARGDMATETEPEVVPIAQRRIISLGQRHSVPTIVATQMLASMTEMPEPTRAEVSDVATAVLLGTDCLMLSDETASGRYPTEAVKYMKRVIKYTETNDWASIDRPPVKHDHTHQSAISLAVIELANNVGASAIVAETKSGATALQIASFRPNMPIIAVTSEDYVAQQLAIVYGTKSYARPIDKLAATKLTNWLKQNKVLKTGDIVVTASGQYPGVVGTTDTIKVRIL